MREFEIASRLPSKKARKLREAMESMGLIEARVVATRGVADLWEIRPTDLGRRIMSRVIEINALLEVAPKGDFSTIDDDDD